ncbi:hypothetical protein ACKJVO_004329 [Cronobacter sakazakii]
MSTISNERLEELRAMFSPSANKDVYLALGELLALRKERERAEPVDVMQEIKRWVIDRGFVGRANYTDEQNALLDAYMGNAWVADDSLPYDPQIAEYEQMMEAEQAQADTTSQQFESLAGKAVVPEGWKLVPVELTKEMRGKIHPFAEATCLNCGRQVVADCEDNVTASWNDMLAVAPEPCK